MKVKGFTLIELVLVIGIAATLAFAAVNAIDVPQRDLDSVSRALKSNIQFAQEMAMTYGSIYGFHYVSATSYSIYNGVVATSATNPLTRGNFEVDTSPVQFTGAAPVDIPFLKTGVPNIAADVTMTLTGGGGTKTITVQQNTGFVTLQ